MGSVPVMASVSGDIIYCPNRFSVASYVYPIAKSNRDMKKYQFEEITFWLSLIACLTAYDIGILWLARILAGISIINLVCAIVMAWIDVKRKL